MTSSSAPKPPTVGQELSSATGALSGGGGGALENSNWLLGQNLAQQNQTLNLQNVNTLTNSLFSQGGFESQAQGQATSLGNSYLANQMGQINQNLGSLSNTLTYSNPLFNPMYQEATGSNFLGAKLDPTLSNLESTQANLGSSINPTLSDLSSQMGQSASGFSNFANSQLNLGSSLTPEESAQIGQASSQADSSRGIFNSNTSAFNQSLAEGSYGQQLLQQREGLAQSAVGLQQGALSGAANITNAGLGVQLGALQGAQQTQTANLQNQFQHQNAGLNQLSALTSIGANNTGAALNTILGQSQAGVGVGNSLWGGGLNIMSSNPANQGAQAFNSLGLFSAAQDNAMTAYNGAFSSQEQNAQMQNSLLGSGIGSGLGLLGSVGSSTGLFSSIGSGIASGLGALFSY